MSRGARSVAQTKARFTGPPAFPDSLLFPPHGEAKCVRGPSGLGASRAEEKGASRLVRAGVLERYVEHGKQAQRSPGGRIVCFDRRVVRHAGYSNRKPRPTVFHESRITSHETRLFFTVVRDGWRHRKPPSGPLPPPASRCFPVRHCSAKILPCASVLAPPGRCFPARCGAAWGGYGAAWAAAVPRAGNTACKVFTNHETRNTRHGFYAFHETRITQHGFFFFPFRRHFQGFPGNPPPGKPRAVQAAFLRVVARHHGYGAWAAAAPARCLYAFLPTISRITCHESRPLFFFGSPLPPRNRCPRTVSRRPPDSFRSSRLPMNPC